ncbi:MAG: fused MFS/spermidine synthase [Candidatus Pacebacteria bacterium]|nr:fused MFS/spermidine synthase [Candidatus Paceibacterota bacterium]
MNFSLISKIVHHTASSISGEIIVREQFGQHSLHVVGVPQSGGIVKQIWQKGIKSLPDFKPVPEVLLLGLGGGTVIHLVKKRWPEAKVFAIELDPQIIVVSRTYFDLDKVSGLKIVRDDAFKAVLQKKHGLAKKLFDLILVDIYLGQSLPGFVETEEFIQALGGLLTKRGVLVFNHLLNKEGKMAIIPFRQRLKKIFPDLKMVQTFSNELLIASKGQTG